MRQYRLDIYTSAWTLTPESPDEKVRFEAPDGEKAMDRADEIMGPRPLGHDGLLYEETSSGDVYQVTISGEGGHGE